MATTDWTITGGQYDTMMTVFDGIRAKLLAEKDILTRVLETENGRTKLKAFAQTDEGKWLREIERFRTDLNQYMALIGWDR